MCDGPSFNRVPNEPPNGAVHENYPGVLVFCLYGDLGLVDATTGAKVTVPVWVYSFVELS